MVQETWLKTILEKKKCKKAKWLSEEALQIAEKRREMKGKGKKERYTHLNAEFQRIARREKKAFLVKGIGILWIPTGIIGILSNEKEQRNTIQWERLEISWKKIRDTKRIFHAKMGTIKNRSSIDLTEAEDIKKRWQEYTEELCKKILMTQINIMVYDHSPRARHPGVWINWFYETSLQTKLVEVMEFQLSYFKSSKMMLW